MKEIAAFEASRKFYGQEYFPYGIDRSGEFSRQQAQLLMNHGYAYQELEAGTRAPANRAEQDFVAVCRGERRAQTNHEKVWFLFRKKTTHPKAIATSYSKIESSLSEAFSEDTFDSDF